MQVSSFSICCTLMLLSCYTATATAGSDDYICTIERFSQAMGDVGPAYQLLKDEYVGRQFTVDRSSGVTIGALKNAVDSKPKIIDSGSSDNSFKVISAVPASQYYRGTLVTALNVMVFVEGEKKPFSYMINDAVYFGTCVSF
ncbi:hypothetical protein [Pseudomonas koreensis]|uniref:Uncharacterized protein n=1 Tax=Pseudomonas koreensis TaxID=198620 RepID=A0A9X2XL69_9PSED|nr:hypothetical protein [Pseudomonas koreensis]MCU7250821.1 hypothetical protein [Pseudomonas koreensis]